MILQHYPGSFLCDYVSDLLNFNLTGIYAHSITFPMEVTDTSMFSFSIDKVEQNINKFGLTFKLCIDIETLHLYIE